MTTPSRPFGLYVHIPYCRSKCLYCDFNSYATAATPWEEYLEALIAELDTYRAHPFSGRRLRTLFFGGGTPSLFPPAFFERLLPRIFAQFPPEAELELTMECNPGTVSREHLRGYREAGFNRMSFGVQSLDPDHLKTLTRLHGPQEAIDAVSLAKEIGFDNLSIDLMFGVPGQTVRQWEEELTRALALPLAHISVYNLTPEEGTALVRQLERGRLFMPDEEVQVEMYRRTRAILRAHGFEPYEISNFSRGRPCRHNLQYWTGGDYLGVGAGAHSFDGSGALPWEAAGGAEDGAAEGLEAGLEVDRSGGARWSTHCGLREYLDTCARGEMPIASSELLTTRDGAAEALLTEGRLMAGIDLTRFVARFGARAARALEERSRPFVRRGLMIRPEGGLALTDEGVLIANSIIEALSLAVDDALARPERPA